MSSYNKKYIKSFDYLRILALLGVFLYHLMPNFVPSGYLGVVIFFVLAGFLTMKQCMDSEESKVSPVKKITDKIFKLYPALLFTIIVVIAFMFFYFRNFLIQLPVDAVSSVLSVNNYAQILRNESYFEAMNSIKPLTHIWALSLEFQFYVLFFLFVTPFYKKSNENKYLISFLLLTLLSIIISIFLVSKGVNLTRIYYGIDTRLSTFLLGAASAVISSKISSTISRVSGLLRLLKYILLFIMIYAMVVNFSSDSQVVGIIITYSVLASALLVILYSDEIKVYEENYEINERQDNVNASNKNVLNKLSTLIVNRSYIIYLIHYPIIVFSNRFLAHANIDMKVFFIIILIVVLVASEVTYRLIQVLFFNHKDRKLSSVLIISMTLIVFASAFIMKNIVGDAPKLADKNDTTWLTETTEDEMLKYFTEQNDDEISRLLETKPIVATNSLITNLEEEESTEGLYDEDGKLILSAEELNSYKIQTVFNRINKVNALVGGDATLTRDEFLEYRNMKISFIGDSVTQGSRGSLSVYFPNAVINAEGNRQLRNALPIFYEMKEKGELGDVVVVALGTNSDSDIRVDVLEEIYDNLDGRMMIILTVAIPYVVMEQQRNAAIRKFAETHDNCHLADWHSTMKTHKEYFIGDDTHPQGLGTDVYAQLIFKTAIESLEWRKVGNEWQYYGSGEKMKFAVEIEKNVGDTVLFGSYFINSSDKKEPIEWIVVDKNEELKTETLISKYVLDRRKYNDVYASTTWQKSSIRKWLGSEFYSEAFENIGAKFIILSALENHKNPEYKTAEANVTYDRVFLPSYDEIKKYLGDKYLKCEGTEYFKSIGGYVNEDGYADWWSRTAGDADNHVLNVSASGEIVMKGDYVTTDDFGIRPMLRVTYK